MMRTSIFILSFLLCSGCSVSEKIETKKELDMGKSLDDISDAKNFDSSSDFQNDIQMNPENCQEHDGDRKACDQAGCKIYNESPIWCVKEGKCLIDKRPHGFCDHVPTTTMNAISSASFREDLGIAIESGKKTAGLTTWQTRPEDETGGPECLCLQQIGGDAVEGKCL